MNLNSLLIGGVLHVRNEQASGTSAVALSAATWNTCTFNTTVTNTIAGASRAGNVITLPAGTYQIFAKAGAYDGGAGLRNHITRWRNTSDGSTAVAGGNAMFNGDALSFSTLVGVFTITAAKNFELQHYPQGAYFDGYGSALGVNNIFTETFIKKLE